MAPPMAAPPRTRAQRWVGYGVFAVTGSLTGYANRVLLSRGLGIDGDVFHGPWRYWLAYLVIGSVLYSALLVLIGTLAGQHTYFRTRLLRFWGRLLPFRRPPNQPT